MLYVLVGMLLAALALLALAAHAAVRREDLLVFYWAGAGFFLFARNPEGTYDALPARSTPAAVLGMGLRRLRERRRMVAAPAPGTARFARLART